MSWRLCGKIVTEQMKRIIFYVFLVIILAYAWRELTYIGIRQNKIGEYDKLNTIFLKKNNFSTVIIGSSRAETHVVPSIIDSVTGQNTFNMGMEGEFMPLVFGILKAYLVHSEIPKNIIINIDYHPYTGKVVVNRFPRFYPYLSNKALYESLTKAEPRYFWFKRNPFYSMSFFNDQYLYASVRGFAGIKSRFDRSFDKGYVAGTVEFQQIFDTIHYVPFYSLPEKDIFENFDSIINLCKQKKINLIPVVTPMYYKGTKAVVNQKELIEKFSGMIKKHDLPFLDYSTDAMCYDTIWFSDPYHLNKKGSEFFSRKFAKDLQQYLVK